MELVASNSHGTLSSRDGTEVFWQRWAPETRPVASVVLIHGAGEHGGRYPHLIERLVAHGHAVTALDLRGHGRSGGRRATLQRFSEYLEDVNALLETEHVDAPVFLAGYSMGGLVAASYALDHAHALRGLVLAAPALGPGDVAHLQLLAARMLSTLTPRIKLLALKPAAMMHDPAAVARYEADPLIYHGRFDARLLGEFVAAIARLNARLAALTLPVLLAHGGEDTLADPEASRRLLAGCGSPDTTLHLYPDTRHDLFNEPAREQVTGDVASWIDAHTGEGGER
jgi:acylglycerol lipase